MMRNAFLFLLGMSLFSCFSVQAMDEGFLGVIFETPMPGHLQAAAARGELFYADAKDNQGTVKAADLGSFSQDNYTLFAMHLDPVTKVTQIADWSVAEASGSYYVFVKKVGRRPVVDASDIVGMFLDTIIDSVPTTK